jgi:hypothetical protein
MAVKARAAELLIARGYQETAVRLIGKAAGGRHRAVLAFLSQRAVPERRDRILGASRAARRSIWQAEDGILRPLGDAGHGGGPAQ